MAMSTPEQTLIINQIAQCYGIEPSQLDCLTDNPDDGVYGFTRQGQDFVVKYTLPTVRSFSTLHGQVDWVNFLAEHGAPVSRPVPSRPWNIGGATAFGRHLGVGGLSYACAG